MRELGPLVLRHLREMWRQRGLMFALALTALLVALLGWTGDASPHAAGRGLAWALGGVAAGAALLGLGAAGWLPGDRAEGRTAWLSAHRPARGTQRVAAALAALAALLLWGGLTGLALLAVGAADAGTLALARVIDQQRGGMGRIAAGAEDGPGPSWSLTLPARPDADTFEIELRAVRLAAVRDRAVALGVAFDDGAPQRRRVGLRSTLRLPLPAEAARAETTLRIASHNPDVALRVVQARFLAAASGHGRWDPLALALWIALGVGCVIPVAMALSRWTSAATAGSSIVALLLLALIAGPLQDLVAGLDTATWAAGILRGASHLAPAFPLFDVAEHLGASRLPPALGTRAVIFAGYALLGLVALAVPGRDSEAGA